MPTSRRQVMQLLRSHTRSVMAAYIADIRRKKISIKDVEEHIGSATYLSDQLALSGGDLSATTEAIRDALKAGGELEGKFNVNAETATQWITDNAAALVTRINKEQMEAIQAVIGTGRTLGENPRTTALDIVGRIGANGKREGGIVGLNGPQANAVSNARANLRSGDPEQMRKYLNNERRDRRYDHIVKAAIAESKPVSKANLQTIITRYQARLLKTRGDTIARTETHQAVSNGRQEQVRQQSGNKPMIKIWMATFDSRTRHDHREMDGQRRKLDEPYRLPDGSRMMHPGDSSMGARAGEVINCRCTERYEVAA